MPLASYGRRGLIAALERYWWVGDYSALDVGVGYRASVAGSVGVFNLGYSHPIEVLMPEGVKISVEANTKITIEGADKQAVGQVAAKIRALRPPDPYKQKGVRYAGEQLIKKEGKTGA